MMNLLRQRLMAIQTIAQATSRIAKTLTSSPLVIKLGKTTQSLRLQPTQTPQTLTPTILTLSKLIRTHLVRTKLTHLIKTRAMGAQALIIVASLVQRLRLMSPLMQMVKTLRQSLTLLLKQTLVIQAMAENQRLVLRQQKRTIQRLQVIRMRTRGRVETSLTMVLRLEAVATKETTHLIIMSKAEPTQALETKQLTQVPETNRLKPIQGVMTKPKTLTKRMANKQTL
mmetsp:Transcript_30585/g.37725  ORF Transcript_30585/g.37725 Transcript_30585/m.37725 type:complete len:227 (+) Transcript_30585:896-1576(+)